MFENVKPNSERWFNFKNLLNEEWDCIKDITRSLGYNYGYIIACCQRKYKLGHNFIWRYKEEIENGMEI